MTKVAEHIKDPRYLASRNKSQHYWHTHAEHVLAYSIDTSHLDVCQCLVVQITMDTMSKK